MPTRAARRLTYALLACALVAAVPGCDSGTGPRRASSISIIGGDNQTTTNGVAFPQPLVVLVLDQAGAAFPGAKTTWAIAQGGGTLSATIVNTDENGMASVTYTPGPASGSARVNVTLDGVGVVTFTLTVEASGTT